MFSSLILAFSLIVINQILPRYEHFLAFKRGEKKILIHNISAEKMQIVLQITINLWYFGIAFVTSDILLNCVVLWKEKTVYAIKFFLTKVQCCNFANTETLFCNTYAYLIFRTYF